MTLQSTKGRSFGNAATELARAASTTTSIGRSAVRTLVGAASAPMSLPNALVCLGHAIALDCDEISSGAEQELSRKSEQSGISCGHCL